MVDLKKPPVDLNAAILDGGAMGGILGAALGESAEETQKRVQEAKKTANDLTTLVRKKPSAPKAEEVSAGSSSETNGKRKAEAEAEGSGEEAKKTKVDA